MKPLIFTKTSDFDIEDAVDFYNSQHIELGDRFLHSVHEKLDKIITNPSAYAIRYRNIHCAKVEHFPFMVHFINESDVIIVVGVIHTSRNPKLWKNRKS